MPKSSGATDKARVLSSREVYRGPAFWVTSDRVLEPSGVQVRRDIVHHTSSVVILAVEESKRVPSILLERQYRHAARRYLWELPAGRIDAGENALAAARRELEEETGYSAQRWKRILHFWASPGFVAEAMSMYSARGLRRGVARPEPDEKILVRLVSLPDAVKMVMRGTIRDAKTIAGILWLSHQQTSKSRNR